MKRVSAVKKALQSVLDALKLSEKHANREDFDVALGVAHAARAKMTLVKTEIRREHLRREKMHHAEERREAHKKELVQEEEDKGKLEKAKEQLKELETLVEDTRASKVHPTSHLVFRQAVQSATLAVRLLREC